MKLRDLTNGVILASFASLFILYGDDNADRLDHLRKSVTFYMNCDSVEKTERGSTALVNPIQEPGIYRQAYRIESHGQNLLDNSGFSTGTEGWIEIGSPSVLTKDGRSEAKCVEVDPENYLRYVFGKAVSGAAYAFSIYAKGENASYRLEIKSGGNKQVLAEIKTGSEYSRASVGIIAETTELIVTIRPLSGKIKLDDAQLEDRKTFPTSYMKEGEHRSVQRVEVRLGADRVSLTEGAFSSWVKMDALGAADGGGCGLFNFAEDPSKSEKAQVNAIGVSAYIKAGAAGWRNSFTVSIRDAASKGVEFTSQTFDELPKNAWMHVAVTWRLDTSGKSTAKIYINGKESGSKSDFALGDFSVPKMGYIGYKGGGALNGLLDEVYLFNQLLSADEIKILYERKGPL